MIEFTPDGQAAVDFTVGDQPLPNRAARLSPRELQVLELASLGLTNMQIALRLQLSVHAVKFHLAAIYRKLEVSNRTEAAFVFLNRAAPAPIAPPEAVGG
jgi:DNA-binding NarL/FixJ family response regulator